jgi:multidrug efflux pump subunit AcrB
MNITRIAISNPVAVIAAVLLVVLRGGVGLSKLPVQMIPDAERPFIQVSTGWRAAAPEEVESEIIEPQEDMLRGIPGLMKMTSGASRGRASISLAFSVETDLQRALIDVMNRLNQVPRYPADVTEPQIYAGQDGYGRPIAWFAITPKAGNDRDIASYYDFVRKFELRSTRMPPPH